MLAACQSVKKEEKPQSQPDQNVVGSGSDLGNADNVSSDLSDEQLNGLDQGLDDIQNI